MIHVSISEEIAKACPELHVAVVQCDVVNTASDEQLWKEITERNPCPYLLQAGRDKSNSCLYRQPTGL